VAALPVRLAGGETWTARTPIQNNSLIAVAARSQQYAYRGDFSVYISISALIIVHYSLSRKK